MAKDYTSNNDIKILSDFGEPFTGQLGITAPTGSIFINEDNGRVYTQTLGPTADNWVEIINTSTAAGATNGVTLDGNDIVLGGSLSQAGATITQFSSQISPYTLTLKDETFYTRLRNTGVNYQNPIDIFRTDTYTSGGKAPYTASVIRIGGNESIPNYAYYVGGTGGTNTGWYTLSDQANDSSADVVINANYALINTYSPDWNSTMDFEMEPNAAIWGRTEFVGGTSDDIARSTYLSINNQDVRIQGRFDLSGGTLQTTSTVDLGDRLYGINISKSQSNQTLSQAGGILMSTANLTGTTVTNYYELYLGGTQNEALINNKYAIYQTSTNSENSFASIIRVGGGLVTQGEVQTLNANTPNISNVSRWTITTSTPSTVTLPDGTYDGQNLTVYMTAASGGITIIPTTPSNFTDIRMTAAGECVDLIWDAGIGWVIKGSGFGVTITP